MTLKAQSGAVTLWLAAALLSLVIFTSVALDTARLAFQRQQLQSIADLAATELGVSSPYFLDPNQKAEAEQTVASLFSDKIDKLTIEYGTAKIVDGRWVIDTSATADNGYPTTKVVVTKKVPESMVAGGLFNNRTMTLYAEAAVQKSGVISFGVGSKTVSTETEAGLLNSLLGNVLGTTLDLDVADYNGLANSSVKLGTLLSALAVDLSLGTTQEVLESSISLLDILNAYADVLSSDGDYPNGINLLINQLALAETVPDIVLGDIVALSETNTDGAALESSINALSLVKASIFASDSSHFIDVPALGVSVPNVASIALATDVITPPSFTITTLPVIESKEPSVSNSQVDLSLSADLDIVDDITSALSVVSLGLANVVVSPLKIEANASKSTATLVGVSRSPSSSEAAFATESSLVDVSVEPLTISIYIPLVSSPIVVTAQIAVNNEDPVTATQTISLAQLPQTSTINRGTLFDTEINLSIEVPNSLILNAVLAPLTTALSSVLSLTLGNVLSGVLSGILLPTLDVLGVQVGGADMWVDAIQSSPSGLIL
ncbi:pilus assembly protein TadG-related protein [Vibrio fluvialis]|uniref:pilus assembly protein TadG-related protein n=1 Tax=Vibrio fluvialis TaxID=676 RepID=UPI00192C2DFD|nr:pilus assembly protein TadG-related protein [Vibrio fluvialis]MBL4240225.1 hypothetical protein [Vibrio fluvialis]MBL4266368.1 hypothetical protein [Vibrio fluvialis]MBL4268934.1 hypothetical protein [Vibrio fluvialis]MBL4275236.1 hypothetical protein [Vibrio fluvialis]MBO1439179.1 hypothetical protein [Vibrio fluvialis]